MNKFMYYLQKILFKVVLQTYDLDKADKSIFQYKYASIDDGSCVTTVLGMINGILPLLPGHPVLVVTLNDEGELIKLGFKKRWW
jgi:hypothetical protein